MNTKMLSLCILFAVAFALTSLPGEGNAIPLVPKENRDLSLVQEFSCCQHFMQSLDGTTETHFLTSQQQGKQTSLFPGHGFGVAGGFPGLGVGSLNGFPGQGNGVSSAGLHAPETMSFVLLCSGLVGLIGMKRIKRGKLFP